jgi:predicted dehydrogenase
MTDKKTTTRRSVLKSTGGIALTAALTPITTAGASMQGKQTANTVRWGVIGTGGIANQMAPMIKLADNAELAAVSSRRMETAQEYADQHGVTHTYDSWQAMITADTIDAVYIATPTSVREEIAVAAATEGKHVLGEKPFANLESLQRITAACRANGVGFMDGTHFVHHPRTAAIRAAIPEKVGRPTSIASAFQFYIADTSNIRLNPALEPLGAIGDVGWYNVRAAVEYTHPDVDIESVCAFARRHPETNAILEASGLIVFSDASTTTFHCGFDSRAMNMDCRIAGSLGQISMWGFIINESDGSASYDLRQQGFGPDAGEKVVVPSARPGAALMFEDFAAMTANKVLFEKSVAASERTQRWLDAVYDAAAGTSS